jgi:hypothetical protein
MVARCCWKDSKPEHPPPVIIETSTPAKLEPGHDKCRVSLDSSFSNDSFCSSGQHRWSQSFECECDRKLDPENELIDLTKSGRTGKSGSRARSSSSSGFVSPRNFFSTTIDKINFVF